MIAHTALGLGKAQGTTNRGGGVVGKLDEAVGLRIDVCRLSNNFATTDSTHLPEHGHHQLLCHLQIQVAHVQRPVGEANEFSGVSIHVNSRLPNIRRTGQ